MADFFDDDLGGAQRRHKLLCNMRFEDVCALLATVRENNHDHQWLSEHDSAIKDLIRHSLQFQQTSGDALETLMRILAYTRSRANDLEWVVIFKDGINLSKYELKDEEKLRRMAAHVNSLLHLADLPEHIQRRLRETGGRTSPRINELAQVYIAIFEEWKFDLKKPLLEGWFEQALSIIYETRRVEVIAKLHESLAYVYAYRAELKQTVDHAQKSYDFWRVMGDHSGMFQAAYAMAYVHRYHRLVKLAEKYTRIARKHAVMAENASLPRWTFQQATVFFEMNRFKESLEWYESALELYSIQPMTDTIRKHVEAACLQGMALSMVWLKKFSAAEARLKRAYQLWKEIDEPTQIANSVYTLGFLEARRSNGARAMELLTEALKLTKNIPESTAKDDLRGLIEKTLSAVRHGELGTRLHPLPD
jgi:tetratricopeptide (TPR) repeat protein